MSRRSGRKLNAKENEDRKAKRQEENKTESRSM
jgi:hypothetical protein